MSFERSPLCKLDGLTPEQRLIHIEWCLAVGMVESAVYHYRLMLPIDFLPGESETLYHRIRAAKESGWNYGAATAKGPLPPNPLIALKAKLAKEAGALPTSTARDRQSD